MVTLRIRAICCLRTKLFHSFCLFSLFLSSSVGLEDESYPRSVSAGRWQPAVDAYKLCSSFRTVSSLYPQQSSPAVVSQLIGQVNTSFICPITRCHIYTSLELSSSVLRSVVEICNDDKHNIHVKHTRCFKKHVAHFYFNYNFFYSLINFDNFWQTCHMRSMHHKCA